MLQPAFPPKLDSAVSLVNQGGTVDKGDSGGEGYCGDHGGDGGDHGGDLLCEAKPKLVAQPCKEAGRPGISTWGGRKS